MLSACKLKKSRVLATFLKNFSESRLGAGVCINLLPDWFVYRTSKRFFDHGNGHEIGRGEMVWEA